MEYPMLTPIAGLERGDQIQKFRNENNLTPPTPTGTETNNVYELEQKIGCGQAEELIIQAENELNLARKMLTWKPWEPLVTIPPPGQWNWPPVKN
ncbi:NADH dehydrogenase 1 alpha subcomplex subunit 5 [Eumeta japonica]|uniref:NADH dehydrogenase 1 alpha subcomplex subunit 5 n=1 Tax=Eumeta variegata TaxID=151549 RepID=A0A4C1ZP23_EUMVA|nr:NADH dehydrogenase 1 alpha subcomplex subunit 5 [Eumeta japonica]